MAFGALKGTPLTGNNASISTSLAATGSVAVNVGDLIFFCLFEQTASTITSAADNLHGAASYTLFTAIDAGTTTAVCGYRRVTVAGTLTSVTATVNGGTNNGVIDAIVIEGPFVTSPLDVHPADISNDITTPYLSPASGALSYSPAVAITWFASTGSAVMTLASPYTKDSEHATAAIGSVRLGHQLVNSLSSIAAASWTGTAPTDDVLGVAVFKAEPLKDYHWPLTNTKAAVNKISMAMVAASGLTLLPQPPFDYCAFQRDAFQDGAFQSCPLSYGWYAPLSGAPKPTKPVQQQLLFAYAPIIAADNNQTIDKWQSPLSRAVPIPRPAPIGGAPFVPKEATRENTTNIVWPLTLGEVARPVIRPAQQGHHLFVPREATLDNTTGKVWPLTQGEIARPISRAAQQGYHLFVPDEPTLKNTTNRVWPLVFGEKARPIPEPAPQGHHLFVPEEATVENTITIAWPLALGEKARPFEQPAQQGYHLFVPEEATIENTTNKVWPLTQGEVARPIVRPAQQGWWAFGYPYLGVDNTTTIEKWQQPLSRSVPIPRPAPVGGSPFVPKEATRENTTNTVWPLAQGEVARPTMRVAQQGTWVFGYPYESVPFDNNITGMGWHQPFYQATPRRPVAKTQPIFVTINFDNNITGMAWHIPFPLVTKLGWPKPNYLRGGQPFVPKEVVFENTGTVATWLMRWQGPPKYRPPKLVAQPFVPREATVDNTIRGMAWHMPLSTAAKHAKVCLTQPFYGRETPTVVEIPVRRVFSDVYYY